MGRNLIINLVSSQKSPNPHISAPSVSANVKKELGSFITQTFTNSRYENAIPLPGLPSGSPDHGFCVLHQKLQMINCCIEVKIAREKNKDEKEESIPLVQPDEVLSGNDDTGKFFS